MAKPKAEPKERKPFKVLTAEEQRALGTGQYALMPCNEKGCGNLGCTIPIPHPRYVQTSVRVSPDVAEAFGRVVKA